MISNYASNILKILNKHKLLSFLMIAFVLVTLLILGFTVDIQQITEKTAIKYEETYGNKAFFYTGESLSDNIYYRYLEDNNDKDFHKLLQFKNKLINSDSFLYTELIEQPLEIINYEIPEIFLVGYESGNSSINKYDGNDSYATKALIVSHSFFEEFSVEVSDGNSFSEEDYLFSEDKEIPLLLGSAYKESFKIGDKFKGYYYLEEKTFIIKGYIKEQSFFFSRSDYDFVSCERYMIVPSIKVEKATEFSKILLLQQMRGMISSTLGYEQTLEIYKQYLSESGIKEWELYIVNPNPETYSVLEMYTAMTNEVSHQFNIMVFIILIFGCITMIIVICGMLKENHFIFGVSLLCGASFRDIVFETLGLVGSILLSGDLLVTLTMLLQSAKPVSFLIVQAAVIIITTISCTACVLYLKRMDVSDIIGGKE